MDPMTDSVPTNQRPNDPTAPSYSPGLEGAVAGVSALSQIDTDNNVLTYRGYNVQDLCDHCSFEEVAYLLFNGELPNEADLKKLNEQLAAESEVPPAVYHALQLLPPESEPMDWLKIAVAVTALFDPDHADNSHAANVR